ncbi:hypothetical protein G7046_g5999 [Stylonectria norvegica]|nr:hypothetical protein G7046_g5999 [Stylonectria norvegica]
MDLHTHKYARHAYEVQTPRSTMAMIYSNANDANAEDPSFVTPFIALQSSRATLYIPMHGNPRGLAHALTVKCQAFPAEANEQTELQKPMQAARINHLWPQLPQRLKAKTNKAHGLGLSCVISRGPWPRRSAGAAPATGWRTMSATRDVD